MRATRWVMAAALAAGVVAVADAQPGRPGAGGGFGGDPVVTMLKNKEVAADLKLSEEQIDKLKTWAKDYEPKAKAAREEKMKGITREDFATKVPAITAELKAETYKELGGVLKTEQVTRLKQIDVQAAGLRAFGRPEVVSALKLTDEQKEKVKAAGEDAGKAMREAFGGGGGGRPDPAKMEEGRAKIAKAQAEALDKVKAALTDEQKAAWKGLTGEPFDTTKLNQGGFGGGGGRQPGAGGNRGNRPGSTPPAPAKPKVD